MAYGGTVKSALPPKVPRPASLSQNDFDVKAGSFAKGGPGELSSPSPLEAQQGEWHWPSLTTAGARVSNSKIVDSASLGSAFFVLTCRRRRGSCNQV